MRRFIWYGAMLWPGALAIAMLSASYFVMSARVADVLGVGLIVGGAFATQRWVRYCDRTGRSDRWMKRLKLEPRDLFRRGNWD